MNKLLKKALSKHKSGDARAAEELYKKVLRDQPDDIDGNYLLGALYAERGELDRALQYTQRAARVAPNSPFIQNNLGNILRLRGDLAGARHCYESAVRLDPSLAEAWNNLGIVLKRLGNDSGAMELYQHAIDCQPLFTQAHFNLGKALWDAGQLDAAAEKFRRVLELQPNHVQAHEGLGSYFLQRGERDQARVVFERCLQLDPADACGARVRLAVLEGGPVPDQLPAAYVRQTYETKAARWDADAARAEHRFLGPEHVHAAFQRWVGARADLDVLDLGCGTGACGAFLRARARRLVGVDLSAPMLEAARHKGAYDELHEGEIVTFLATHEAQYDVVVASGVLIFFGDLAPVFGAVHARLRDAGAFIFSLYRSDDAEVAVRANYHFAHSGRHVRARALEAGLQVEQIEAVVHEFDHGVEQPGWLVTLTKSAAVPS